MADCEMAKAPIEYSYDAVITLGVGPASAFGELWGLREETTFNGVHYIGYELSGFVRSFTFS